MKDRTQLVLAAVAMLCAAPAPAASPATGKVWIVDDDGGPGVDFTSVQGAVDAASDGDVLVVRAGAYGATLVAGRSLVLIAEAGDEPVLSELTIRATPPGGKVVVRGLQVASDPETAATTIESNAGLVLLEDVTSRGAPACDVRGTNDDVVAIRASFLGHDGQLPSFFFPFAPELAAGLGLRIVNLTFGDSRRLTLQDCLVRGGAGASAEFAAYKGQGGGLGLLGPEAFPPTACQIIASGCTFQGGHGGAGHSHICAPWSPPGCTPECTSGGSGGAGFSAHGVLYELDCVYAGGFGGSSQCGPGQPGTPKSFQGSETALPGPARSYAVSSPVREAQAIQLDFQGVPGDLAYLLFHTAFDPTYVGPCQGTILPSLTSGLIVIFVGAVDATGALGVSVPAPALGPGVESLVAATQANLVSPDVACHVTTGSVLVLLDSAF